MISRTGTARQVAQARQLGILGRKHRAVRAHRPFNAQIGVIPDDAAIILRAVIAGHLIQEFHILGEGAEAVEKALGNPELRAIVRAQLHRHMLAEGGGAVADIHRHIQHRAARHPHQLALPRWRLLEMKPRNVPFAADRE